MAFTITGRVTDLDMDVTTDFGLTVTPVIAAALGSDGGVRVREAKGRFNSAGYVVKDVPYGHIEEPWIIGAREGTSLRLSPTTFLGYFPQIQFEAPADGSSVSLRSLVEANTPTHAKPKGKFVRGMSAYEVAVANGFVGTETEWIESLVGEPGEQGPSAYDIAVAGGFVGTEHEWLLSLGGSAEAVNFAIDEHIQDPEPHDAYDRDLTNLTVLFDNLLT